MDTETEFQDKYNTPLNPDQMDAYNAWRQTLPKRLNWTGDYDLQGYFKKNGPVQASGDIHFTDEFKKPSHPTFSDQSIYHGTDGYYGGKWNDNQFTPGPTNLQFHDKEGILNYFGNGPETLNMPQSLDDIRQKLLLQHLIANPQIQ